MMMEEIMVDITSVLSNKVVSTACCLSADMIDKDGIAFRDGGEKMWTAESVPVILTICLYLG